MPGPTVTITVTTPDGVPADPPYKISRDPDKDDISFSWTATFGPGGGPIWYWQERLGGSLRTNGKIRRHLGIICGIGNRCGEDGSRALAMGVASESDIYLDADADMPSEGDYRFGVDAMDNGGWSS